MIRYTILILSLVTGLTIQSTAQASKPRTLDLETTAAAKYYSNHEASGRVIIFHVNGPEQARYGKLPPRFGFTVRKMATLDRGPGYAFPGTDSTICLEYPFDTSCAGSGTNIYVMYIWTRDSLGNTTEKCNATSCRTRILSFNVSLTSDNYSTERMLYGFPMAEALFTTDLCVEIWVEEDDGFDGPDIPGTGILDINRPHLQGESAPGMCAALQGTY